MKNLLDRNQSSTVLSCRKLLPRVISRCALLDMILKTTVQQVEQAVARVHFPALLAVNITF